MYRFKVSAVLLLVALVYLSSSLLTPTAASLSPEKLRSIERYVKGDGAIFFQHTHKAGGSSLCTTAILNKVPIGPNTNCNPLPTVGAPEDQILFTLPVEGQMKVLDILPQDWKEYDQSVRSRKFIANEAPLPPELAPTGDRFVYMISIRDPIDRMISQFLHQQRDKRNHTNNFTEWFAWAENKCISNMAVRNMVVKCEGEVTEEDLEIAKKKLREVFTLVLPVERFDDVKLLLQHYLGWNVFIRNPTNVRPKEQTFSLTNDERAMLETKERYDIALYQYGVSLFEELLQSVRSELSAEQIRDYLNRRELVVMDQ